MVFLRLPLMDPQILDLGPAESYTSSLQPASRHGQSARAPELAESRSVSTLSSVLSEETGHRTETAVALMTTEHAELPPLRAGIASDSMHMSGSSAAADNHQGPRYPPTAGVVDCNCPCSCNAASSTVDTPSSSSASSDSWTSLDQNLHSPAASFTPLLEVLRAAGTPSSASVVGTNICTCGADSRLNIANALDAVTAGQGEASGTGLGICTCGADSRINAANARNTIATGSYTAFSSTLRLASAIGLGICTCGADSRIAANARNAAATTASQEAPVPALNICTCGADSRINAANATRGEAPAANLDICTCGAESRANAANASNSVTTVREEVSITIVDICTCGAASSRITVTVDREESFGYCPQCIECCRYLSEYHSDSSDSDSSGPDSPPGSDTSATDTMPGEDHDAMDMTGSDAMGSNQASGAGEREHQVRGSCQQLEGPYATLIHRALISQPNHSMTLQEIYKWFRENTTKAKKSYKGWQNSIRHNLSMNAAFTNRDLSGKENAKRSAEWVLEDWAVSGVQSTTRYRKGGPSRRSTRRSRQRPYRSSKERTPRWITDTSVMPPSAQAPVMTTPYHMTQPSLPVMYSMDHQGSARSELESIPHTPDQAMPASVHHSMILPSNGPAACSSDFAGIMAMSACGEPAQVPMGTLSTCFPYPAGDMHMQYINSQQAQAQEGGLIGSMFLNIPDGVSGWEENSRM
ncbi:hypothetical protein B0I35DRAFT_410424 [Stachybotrys elegans]|uniref:Fork-head domain-containing protein n=1 Tax=Stachybotrys elegans TaxID=80388 RepID=A0A8K0SN69_9HYPO|nr:hypothetical protein B0I35DRAFT_410424 [Stachybotrys elegans]